ncbi:hypothetical protein BJX66DRAFT_30782 [Aspergillus keveii]|uniref:DUF7702 domain-containing protein n=1 Tax=Aspergillus keveii TaxID=714993 RepID=A0ABR4FT64_9EURO
MSLTPHQSLSLALLILYTPALYPTSLLLHRHGLGHAWGWLYLFVFTVLRILGAALQFASGYTHDEDNGLRVAARMLASIGVMTLLLGMLEGVEILKPSLRNDPIPPRLWTLLHLSQYAAFILSIIFTTTGREDLSYASAMIVACLFVVLVGIVVVFYIGLRRASSAPIESSLNDVEEGEEHTLTLASKQPSSDENTRDSTTPILPKTKTTLLLRILLASIPFLAIRVTYMLLATFTHDRAFTGRELDGSPNTGSWTTAEMEANILPDVYVVAFMQYAMEIVVFGLFIGTGFVVPPSRRRQAIKEQGGDETRVEMGDTTRGVGRGQCRV